MSARMRALIDCLGTDAKLKNDDRAAIQRSLEGVLEGLRKHLAEHPHTLPSEDLLMTALELADAARVEDPRLRWRLALLAPEIPSPRFAEAFSKWAQRTAGLPSIPGRREVYERLAPIFLGESIKGTELKDVLQKLGSESPESALEAFAKLDKMGLGLLFGARNGSGKKTLGEHTWEVNASAEALLASLKLPPIEGVNLRRVVRLATFLHDIGKPVAGSDEQYAYTRPLAKAMLDRLGISTKEQKLVISLIAGDPIGPTIATEPGADKINATSRATFAATLARGDEKKAFDDVGDKQGVTWVDAAHAEIKKAAKAAGLSEADFFRLQSVLYLADASSYEGLRRFTAVDGVVYPQSFRFQALEYRILGSVTAHDPSKSAQVQPRTWLGAPREFATKSDNLVARMETSPVVYRTSPNAVAESVAKELPKPEVAEGFGVKTKQSSLLDNASFQTRRNLVPDKAFESVSRGKLDPKKTKPEEYVTLYHGTVTANARGLLQNLDLGRGGDRLGSGFYASPSFEVASAFGKISAARSAARILDWPIREPDLERFLEALAKNGGDASKVETGLQQRIARRLVNANAKMDLATFAATITPQVVEIRIRKTAIEDIAKNGTNLDFPLWAMAGEGEARTPLQNLYHNFVHANRTLGESGQPNPSVAGLDLVAGPLEHGFGKFSLEYRFGDTARNRKIFAQDSPDILMRVMREP